MCLLSADAPIYSHIFEDALVEDMLVLGYTDEGHTKGESSRVLKPPQRLEWEIPNEVCHHVYYLE